MAKHEDMAIEEEMAKEMGYVFAGFNREQQKGFRAKKDGATDWAIRLDIPQGASGNDTVLACFADVFLRTG